MILRLALRLLGVVTLTAAVVLASPVPTGAATVGPDDQSWWSEAQQTPSPAPTIPIGMATGGNLMVGNDPSGPNAIAAVRYTVPGTIDGEPVDASTASGTLTLRVPAGTTVGTPAIVACPVTSSWQAAHGGSWSVRPQYKCATNAVGTFATDGASVTFALSPTLQVRDGVFDLAIVPNPANQTPFSLQFAAPGADSLNVMASPAPAATPDSTVPDTSVSPAFDANGASTSPAFLPDLGTLPATPGPSGLTPAAGGGAAAAPAPQLAFAQPVLPPAPAKRVQRAIALAILVGIGVAVWWFGGRPVRAPRLLGSLGANVTVDEHVFVRDGGIGRFARPRPDRPPRL